MRWSLFDDGLRNVIRTASRTTDLSVQWEEQPNAWESTVWAEGGAGTGTDLWVRLDVVGTGDVGMAEHRWVQDPDDATRVQERVYLNRFLNLQVAVNTDSQLLSGHGLLTADMIRLNLRSTDVQAQLRALGLSVQGIGNTRNATFTDHDGRRNSAAIFEITFNGSTALITRIVDCIAQVRIHGRLRNPDITLPVHTVVL